MEGLGINRLSQKGRRGWGLNTGRSRKRWTISHPTVKTLGGIVKAYPEGRWERDDLE